MYRDVLLALATELERVTGREVVRNKPAWGRVPLALPLLAVILEAVPLAVQTRVGAAAAVRTLDWTAVVAAADDPTALTLLEDVVTWLDGTPSLTISGKTVRLRRSDAVARVVNEYEIQEQEHAFTIALKTEW